MSRPLVRLVLCGLLLVIAGCSGGTTGPEGTDGGWVPGTETVDGTPVCLYPPGDPAIPECLVGERPPDIGVEHLGGENYDLTVRVSRANGTVVYSETKTVLVAGSDPFTDVVDRPGSYVVNATLNGTTSATVTWDVGQRVLGGGDVYWIVEIGASGEIELRRQQYI